MSSPVSTTELKLIQVLDLESFAKETYEKMMDTADKGDAYHSMSSEEAITVIHEALKSASVGVQIFSAPI